MNIKDKIHVLVGDISTINAEVIVTSANRLLTGGCGVDCAVHKNGGSKILEECLEIKEKEYPKGLEVGEAIITNAGNLKAKYVIHTLAPKYKLDNNPKASLESCYRNSLLLADNYKCKSVAFPAIATGVYAYPKDEAAKIVYDIITKLILDCKYIKDIVFVYYSAEDASYFKKYLE